MEKARTVCSHALCQPAYKTAVREIDVNRLGATYPLTGGSTSSAILPSWMGGHGISWESREKMENTENTENTENMENTQNKEKMENISQMTATLDDSKPLTRL